MSARPDDASTWVAAALRREGQWLLPVLITALVTHGCVYFFFHYEERSNDEMEYLALGVSLADHSELRLPTGEYAKRVPLFPTLIAAVDRWQGRKNIDSAIIELQTILSFASMLLIALIARRLSDHRGAIVAGLVAALYAPFRYLQSVYLTETLVIALLMAALFLYLIALDSKWPELRWMALGGASVMLGLSVLTRADAGVFVIPFALHALWRRGSTTMRVFGSVVLLIGVVLATLAWGIRNHRVIGAWTMSTTAGLNFYLGNNPDYAKYSGMDRADYGAFDRLRREGLSEVEADRRLSAMGRSFVVEHPAEWAANLLRKVRVWAGTSIKWTPPGTLLIIAWTLALAGRATRYRKGLFATATLLSLVWLAVFWQMKRPWTHPMFVFPLGLIGLFAMRDRLKVRGLLVGIIAAQLAVAVAFIPLERLRWTVDGIFIVALAAAVARLCEAVARQSEPRG